MNTKVTIAGVEWNNPVTVASGTFGSGAEFTDFVDLNRLGAVTTKGVANVPWTGNPTPRVAETYGGMMNAVGLQNPGIDVFCERDIPFLRKYDTKIIVNVCGRSTEDYCEVVERLANEDVDMLEINISCPNVKEGGIAFGQNPNAAEEITKAVKKYAKQPIIMKLSPNVTSISEMAKAVEAGGADAVSLINTLTGMKIDVNKKAFVLANKTGGVSGPAIHPIAVRMVYEAANVVSVPVIGMGGIASAEDAIEMILAGASAVSVGTANFFDPATDAAIIRRVDVVFGLAGVNLIDEEVARDVLIGDAQHFDGSIFCILRPRCHAVKVLIKCGSINACLSGKCTHTAAFGGDELCQISVVENHGVYLPQSSSGHSGSAARKSASMRVLLPYSVISLESGHILSAVSRSLYAVLYSARMRTSVRVRVIL